MMQLTNTWRQEINLSWALAAIALGLGVVLLEAVFQVPVRLPGHRALPGALALLLFAEALPPLLLLGFALAVPLALSALGTGEPLMIAVWLIAAVLAVLLSRPKVGRALWSYMLIGLLFGGLRCLTLWFGLHHTPQPARLAGHLAFGAVAGLLAWGAARLMTRRSDEASQP